MFGDGSRSFFEACCIFLFPFSAFFFFGAEAVLIVLRSTFPSPVYTFFFLCSRSRVFAPYLIALTFVPRLCFFFWGRQESFLLDFIEGIANNHHGSSRDSLTQLADHVLDGMSKTLIYPSAPTVKFLVEVCTVTALRTGRRSGCESPPRLSYLPFSLVLVIGLGGGEGSPPCPSLVHVFSRRPLPPPVVIVQVSHFQIFLFT